MQLSANQITVAVTVFNRRQYLKQAISSALNQTVPVRVIVVEDCGPDPGLKDFVKQEFGARIEYFRNPRRRGLFGNWNACIDYCPTPWLSILHDDDFLAPDFAENLIKLNGQAPDCGLYYGLTAVVDEAGRLISSGERTRLNVPWRKADLADAVEITPFNFPGHLFRVDCARALGGFRETSQYTGDWEMWSRLMAHYGAAQANVTMAYQRSHFGLERGSVKIFLNGRLRPLTFVQQKRVLHLLRQKGTPMPFQRKEFLRRSPMPTSFLIQYGASLSPRLLRYHVELLRRSHPPNRPYAVFQGAARVFGVPFVKAAGWFGRLIGFRKEF